MNRIAELRKARGWRQSDLAERLHTTQQAVGHWETERRGLDVPTIHALCDLFGVSADYLLGRSALPGDGLSEEEQQLVRRFRALDRAGRDYLLLSLGYAEAANAQKNNAVFGVEAAK